MKRGMKPLDPVRFQCAVRFLALYSARSAVLAQMRAEGLKVSHYSSREINEKRDAYFASRMEELIAKALVDVWRLPMFAKYRPTQPQPKACYRSSPNRIVKC